MKQADATTSDLVKDEIEHVRFGFAQADLVRNDQTMMIDVQAWKRDMRAAITSLELSAQGLVGYPVEPGDNRVRDTDAGNPRGDIRALPSALSDFYSSVAEVALPDVHIGYFIHRVEWVLGAGDRNLPTKVAGPERAVATFGSDGGGGLFCLVLGANNILHLPPGELRDGVYLGGMEDLRQVSAGIDGFLELLLHVVQQFALAGRTNGI